MLRNLHKPPTPLSAAYLQADYIELLCLATPERVVGVHDVLYRFKQDAELDSASKFERLSRVDAETYDRQLSSINEWFTYIASRREIFDDLYPYDIDSRSRHVSLKLQLSEIQRLYLYLLMASSLRCFNSSDINSIGKTFEVISEMALRQYIGDNSCVHIFGTPSSSRYTGNKYSKIQKLAQDLRDELIIEEDAFPKTDTGDEGLDIVAWIPPVDRTSSMIIVFGQCACTEDWEEKQSSSAFDKWSQLIRFTARPVNAIFIPFCFRDISGGWYRRHRIHNALLMDRLRILRLLESSTSRLTGVAGHIRKIVDVALESAELE